ncbi:MAG: MoaD/ThiS family protein [Bacteroidetes bacterium]|nr:MoaD/ThiS family protein [Bacteroidota bacterium]
MENFKTNKLKLLAFGLVAERMNLSSIEIEDIYTVNELQEWIVRAYPQLKNVKYSIAINRKIVKADSAIPWGAEIALLPPFSGG